MIKKFFEYYSNGIVEINRDEYYNIENQDSFSEKEISKIKSIITNNLVKLSINNNNNLIYIEKKLFDKSFVISYNSIIIFKNDDYYYVKCEIYISMISRTKMKYNNYYYKCDQLNNLLKLLSKEIPKLS